MFPAPGEPWQCRCPQCAAASLPGCFPACMALLLGQSSEEQQAAEQLQTRLFQRGKAPGTSVRMEKPNVTQDTELKLKPSRFCLKSCVPCAPVTRNDKVIANISQASQRSRSNKEHEKQLCKQSLSPGSAAQARLCPSAPGSAGKTPPARPGCSHQHPQHVLPDCHRERFQKEIRKSISIGFSADSSLAPGVLNGLPLIVRIHLISWRPTEQGALTPPCPAPYCNAVQLEGLNETGQYINISTLSDSQLTPMQQISSSL